MRARTSSRRFSMISGVSPSRFNRNMTRRLDRTAWLWRKRPFLAYIDRGTGSNAGKVRPVHRDMFDGKFGGVFGSADHSKERGLRTTAPRFNSVWMTLNDEAMSEHLHQRVRLVVGKAQFQDLSSQSNYADWVCVGCGPRKQRATNVVGNMRSHSRVPPIRARINVSDSPRPRTGLSQLPRRDNPEPRLPAGG
jgi:hypothetical protein